MAECIERKAFIEAVKDIPMWGSVAVMFADSIPTADVVPVVHGRWELVRKGDWLSVFVCSVCGRRETIAEIPSYNSQLEMSKKYPYCHCGAKMDGGDENAAD